MRQALNVLMILIIAYLAYMLYNSIKEPIEFAKVKSDRIESVANRLKQVRSAQEIYKAIHGQYASDFDSLITSLQLDSIPFENIQGDEDDPTGQEIIRFFTYTAAIDSVNSLGLNLDSLRFVPFSGGQKFNIEAGITEYQNTMVNVVQVSTRWNAFMGQYADKRFSKYDSGYDPDALVKFGDMNRPILSGNWE
jgi:hypothetical protein